VVPLGKVRTMSLIIQVIITGLSIGAVYALFSLCISVLYRLTGVIHLAIGELAALAVFTVILVTQGTDPVAGEASRVSLPLAVALALVLAALSGGLVYRVGILPFLRQGFSAAWVGGVLGFALLLRGIVRLFFTEPSYRMPELFPLQNIGTDGVISLGDGATLRATAVLAGIVALVVVIAATWLLEHSRSGMELRAASEDRVAAALCGVSVLRVQLWAFCLAAFLAGAIGLVTASGQIVTPLSGSLLGLKGLIAAVIARFGSPRRVVVVALGLGVLETTLASASLGSLDLGPPYAEVVPIAVAILLIAFWGDRPRLQERA
jgi:branched-chain amino acid transport system permease protein